METFNKNIIYTYVPPEIDWECNRDYYLIDLICMVYSVRLFKNKFKYKKVGDNININKKDYLITETKIGNSNKLRINLKLIEKMKGGLKK